MFSEPPLLMYACDAMKGEACARCLALAPPAAAAAAAAAADEAVFCGPACAASFPPDLLEAYRRIPRCGLLQDEEERDNARFLLHACALRAAAAAAAAAANPSAPGAAGPSSSYAQLMELQEGPAAAGPSCSSISWA